MLICMGGVRLEGLDSVPCRKCPATTKLCWTYSDSHCSNQNRLEYNQSLHYDVMLLEGCTPTLKLSIESALLQHLYVARLFPEQ